MKTEVGFTPVTPVEDEGPPDRFNIVYFILLLHGIGTLMPWNMFINASEYFEQYKLQPKNDNDTTMTLYQSYFLNYLGIVAQVPNVLLNGINVFCQCRALRGSTSKRIIWSIIIVVICFIITVILAMLDSSTWQVEFFWITMVTVVFINMANGVYQNSVYGTAACLPMKYTNAVVLGSNTSGTITAVINIIAIAATPNPRSSAIYYFLTAIFILLIAFDTYFALPLFPFFRFHQKKAEKAIETADGDNEDHAMPPFWEIFKECYKQHLGVWCVFFVTLSCFPAIQAGIMPSNDYFSPRYFTAVTCFLFFNAFAMFGNLVTEWLRFPGPRWVWIPIVARLLFIPFFMFCNYKPNERHLPVFITNDIVYMIGSIIMAFTSGYFSSLTMMYAPRSVTRPEHQGIAGMMAAFFLISGIFSGILFSLPLTYILQNVG